MKKQDQFCNQEMKTEGKIKKVMQREFPLPENVEMAKQSAFTKIRNGRVIQEAVTGISEERVVHNSRKVYFRSFAGAAAAVMVFSAVCITNPALAAKIPLVGHVFEELGETMGFSGDFEEYATPLTEEIVTEARADEKANMENAKEEENSAMDLAENQENGQVGTGAAAENSVYSITQNGMTVTLSEVYCNDMALYISMVIETEEEFPDTVTMQDTDTMLLDILNSTLKFSYNDSEKLVMNELDGKLMDEHTYAGVLRYNLEYSADTTDYDGYYAARDEFILQQGVSEEELENDYWAAMGKVCEKLGIPLEGLSNQALTDAGGPDLQDYQSSVEIPEEFTVELNIPQISGIKPDGQQPEMPEDIRAEYEQAMAEHGLGLTDEDYSSFTEEQKDIEHQLFTKMWNDYAERYPETREWPNPYLTWEVEGPWNFTLNVKKDSSKTVVKEINDVDENNIGLKTVTKTPFELIIKDSGNIDCFTVVLDADGEPLDNGNTGGSTNVLAVSDHDVSKIDVFICDYVEYMDEIKGYYWSEDYEEMKKTKTYKQFLEERALYHKEIVF